LSRSVFFTNTVFSLTANFVVLSGGQRAENKGKQQSDKLTRPDHRDTHCPEQTLNSTETQARHPARQFYKQQVSTGYTSSKH